jgi:hypothetical protein
MLVVCEDDFNFLTKMCLGRNRELSFRMAQMAGERGIPAADPKTGQPRFNSPRMLRTDLDSLPFPAWDLVDVDRYREAWNSVHGFFSLNMVSSRGCPYRCNWCAAHLGRQLSCPVAAPCRRRDAAPEARLSPR